jgi:hypothetical protein
MSGKNSPSWRGGHKYWKEGRFGRDKNGLSWKKQRNLSWERDNFTCQKCGKKKVTRNLDCHHIVPYRLSYSHTLDNLITLCKRCHIIEDSLIKDRGIENKLRRRKLDLKSWFKFCGTTEKKLNNNMCRVCEYEKVIYPRICLYRRIGFSYKKIGDILGVSLQTAHVWHHKKKRTVTCRYSLVVEREISTLLA